MVDVKYQAGVWHKLIELIRGQKFWIEEVAQTFGITPLMAQALHEIPAGEMVTMKGLAGVLCCDASNVTGIVDRLEERGLVERHPSDSDRRLKCIALTPAGKRLRRKVSERLTESPPAIAALSAHDQSTLAAILDRALAHAHQQRAQRGT